MSEFSPDSSKEHFKKQRVELKDEAGRLLGWVLIDAKPKPRLEGKIPLFSSETKERMVQADSVILESPDGQQEDLFAGMLPARTRIFITEEYEDGGMYHHSFENDHIVVPPPRTIRDIAISVHEAGHVQQSRDRRIGQLWKYRQFSNFGTWEKWLLNESLQPFSSKDFDIFDDSVETITDAICDSLPEVQPFFDESKREELVAIEHANEQFLKWSNEQKHILKTQFGKLQQQVLSIVYAEKFGSLEHFRSEFSRAVAELEDRQDFDEKKNDAQKEGKSSLIALLEKGGISFGADTQPIRHLEEVLRDFEESDYETLLDLILGNLDPTLMSWDVQVRQENSIGKHTLTFILSSILRVRVDEPLRIKVEIPEASVVNIAGATEEFLAPHKIFTDEFRRRGKELSQRKAVWLYSMDKVYQAPKIVQERDAWARGLARLHQIRERLGINLLTSEVEAIKDWSLTSYQATTKNLLREGGFIPQPVGGKWRQS